MSSYETDDNTFMDDYVAATQARDELRAALAAAVGVIKDWHNIVCAESLWPTYFNNAPEMKPIREALMTPTQVKGIAIARSLGLTGK